MPFSFLLRKNVIMPLLVLVSFLFGFTQAEAEEKEYIINTLPESSFINATNMAPGDTISSNLELIFNGKSVTEIHMSSKKERGSSELYRVLTLKIYEGEKIIYNGNLMELNNLFLGDILKEHDVRKFVFIIGMPKEVTNSFQGTETVVSFDFSSTAFPEDYQEKSLLPNTATNIGNFIMIGVLFIIGGLSIIGFYNKRMRE